MGNTLYDKMFVSIGKTVPSAQVWQIELIAKATEQTAIQAQIDLLKKQNCTFEDSRRTFESSHIKELKTVARGINVAIGINNQEIKRLTKKLEP